MAQIKKSRRKARSPWLLCIASALSVLGCLVSPVAHAQSDPSACGPLRNGNNGPFDYRVERGPKLKVVEEYHFAEQVEVLVSGQTGALGQDLDYVLLAFPNHHRALAAMMRLGARSKSPQAPRATYTVECYFERAIRFKGDDTTVRMIYATFLNDNKRSSEAVAQLNRVISLSEDNEYTQYNVGLLFAEFGLYDQALTQAHKALAMGFTRTDLRERLVKVGKWVDPPADAASSAASAPPGP